MIRKKNVLNMLAYYITIPFFKDVFCVHIVEKSTLRHNCLIVLNIVRIMYQ